MNIKAIFTIRYSQPDFAGNRYWGFTYTDCQTEQTVEGTISGGEGNIYSAVWQGIFKGSHDFTYHVEPMAIREFNCWSKGLPYAGCDPDKIAAFIVNATKEGSSIASA